MGVAQRSTEELEPTLLAAWIEALRCTNVDPTVDLFDLGVHSLMAVEVLSKIQARTGIPVVVTDLFRFPTVRQLAAHLASPGPRQSAAAQRVYRPSVTPPTAQRGARPRPTDGASGPTRTCRIGGLPAELIEKAKDAGGAERASGRVPIRFGP